jgi:hypothetical protein
MVVGLAILHFCYWIKKEKNMYISGLVAAPQDLCASRFIIIMVRPFSLHA